MAAVPVEKQAPLGQVNGFLQDQSAVGAFEISDGLCQVLVRSDQIFTDVGRIDDRVLARPT